MLQKRTLFSYKKEVEVKVLTETLKEMKNIDSLFLKSK